jgi:hypothetical protein
VIPSRVLFASRSIQRPLPPPPRLPLVRLHDMPEMRGRSHSPSPFPSAATSPVPQRRRRYAYRHRRRRRRIPAPVDDSTVDTINSWLGIYAASVHRIQSQKSRLKRSICIIFDEAQTQVETTDTIGDSQFIVLHRALSSLLASPLFTFFLSTTGEHYAPT